VAQALGMTLRAYHLARFVQVVDALRWAREFHDIHAITLLTLEANALCAHVPKRLWPRVNQALRG